MRRAEPSVRRSIVKRIVPTAAVGTLCFVAAPIAKASAITFEVGGDATPASITATRDAFRTALGGGTTPGANGSFGGLRREINWDGVPAQFSAPNNLPSNFFNSNSPRGAVFSTPGTGFQVSGATVDAGAGQPAAANFGNLDAAYTTIFQQFSAQRLFTPLGSIVTDVSFFLPGTTTPATVSGFGAVFTDADIAGASTMQFFDASDTSLGTFNVPVGTVTSQSLSFLGVTFNAGERVARVRITSGNQFLGSRFNDGGATDLVVMDDFIYSEPVPEPSCIALSALGLLLVPRRRKPTA
jgi:hypothetical protein